MLTGQKTPKYDIATTGSSTNFILPSLFPFSEILFLAKTISFTNNWPCETKWWFYVSIRQLKSEFVRQVWPPKNHQVLLANDRLRHPSTFTVNKPATVKFYCEFWHFTPNFPQHYYDHMQTIVVWNIWKAKQKNKQKTVDIYFITYYDRHSSQADNVHLLIMDFNFTKRPGNLSTPTKRAAISSWGSGVIL